MATHTAIAAGHELPGRLAGAARPSRHPWALALAVAIPLAAFYLIVSPPAGDLAAATYRSELFARVGFATWDTGWYAAHGHWLPGYSLLSPVLGALLGLRVLLVLSAVAASVLFALIARRAFGPNAARVAAALFALGFCVELLSGRVPYDLGFAIGLGAVLALMQGVLPLALGLAALTSVASPVAGVFLALAGLACAVADARRGLALTAAALAPIGILNLAYPESGYEPFGSSDFWLTLGGVVLIALLLPQGSLSARARRVVRVGAALYALALIASFAIDTPVGGNAARLGPPLAAPLLAGVMWERRRLALLLLAPVLLYWQLITPIHDVRAIAGDPSVNASYYAPLLSELRQLRHGAPTIVEVPLTKAHWEAAYLADHDGVALARGWERQLDTRYGAIFYRPTLTPSAYRSWLAENRVVYVALPDARLDKAGRLEGALIAGGLPYLRELWRSGHWRLYRVMG
ncbi:MAG TPA: hypothetical protein VFV03_07140 [Solirubrobacteraceae bacterium]|nr:hypothetical protein [Solirubrobacteraceae bacterium]